MSIFETYFKSRLVEMGWPEEMDVRWSLGSCQGDGVSFTGELTPEEMLTLYKRDHIDNTSQEKKGAKFVQALRNTKAELELFEYAGCLTDSSELAVSLKRSENGRYVHRCMVDANNDRIFFMSTLMSMRQRMLKSVPKRLLRRLVCKHSLMDGMKAIGSPGTTVGVIMSKSGIMRVLAFLKKKPTTSSSRRL
ncbi:hypothetical protein [Halomonas casei]|uniref:hypothetical protein n=1 Tax=Halomonas casei TaxID=2742613 RepID=UPI003CF3E56C